MAKSLDELLASKGGATAESNGMGGQERPHNPAGLYRHDESDTKIIAKWHPIYGSAQADAAVRLGFKWVREATKEELRDKIEAGLVSDKPAAAGVSSEDLKGLQARMNALEEENKTLKAANESSVEVKKDAPKAKK